MTGKNRGKPGKAGTSWGRPARAAKPRHPLNACLVVPAVVRHPRLQRIAMGVAQVLVDALDECWIAEVQGDAPADGGIG